MTGNAVKHSKKWAISILTGLVISLTNSACNAKTQSEDKALTHAKQLLQSSILIDGHNDLLWTIREQSNSENNLNAYDISTQTPGDTDIPRLREGRVSAQFWSVWIPPEVEDNYPKVQLEQIDLARRLIDHYDDLTLALTAADIRKAKKHGKIASLIGMEGAYAMEDSLSLLRTYYALGVRYMTLTHGITTDWADSATDKARHGGLSPFGEEVVREMNRLGMLVDLSHVSALTMNDALDISEAPVIFSHSSARAITDHPRNVPDDVLKRMKQNGGVVMVTFVPAFVSQAVSEWETEISDKIKGNYLTTEEINLLYEQYKKRNPMPRALLTQVADHIDHVADVAGIDHVGIGSDFWGGEPNTQGLEDVSKFPYLFAELIRRGWSDEELKKLAGENLLRAMEQAEQVAKTLQQQREPSTRVLTKGY